MTTREHRVVEDSDQMSLENDRRSASRRKLFRFDPTVSSGTLIQVLALVGTLGVAYATYQSDRTQMKADISAVRVENDIYRTSMRESLDEIRKDIRATKDNIVEIKTSVAVLKAQTEAKAR